MIGSEIHIPGQIDRDQLEARRQEVERELTRLTEEAEAWAVSGEPRDGEVHERKRVKTSEPAPKARPIPVLPLPATDSSKIGRRSA